jgi:hypothetical protein
MLKLIPWLLLVAIGMFFGMTFTGGRANPPSVLCKDGERFFIDEQDIMEAGHLLTSGRDLILIELKQCKLTYFRDGVIFKTYTVAVGKRSTPSPVGEWKVIHKGGNWGGGFGTRWIGLNVPWGIYGIHGTDKPQSIGYASSHGCIRMNNRNVNELYNLVRLGTPVHIIGDLPKVNFRKEYRRKETGKHILNLQFALRKAGFDPGPADGRFGLNMEQAVFRFEKFYGLPEDGQISLDEQYLLGTR